MLWQSDNLPGRPEEPSRPLRLRAKSRALRAAIRAVAAEIDLRAISFHSAGCDSSQAPNSSFNIVCTKDFISVLPSLVFV